MKQKILVEGKWGHGGKIQSRLRHAIKRKLRPSVGKATLPFDWTRGISGKPVYNIKNQYQSDSCWGQAYSRLIQILRGGEELSAKSAYSPIYAPGGGVVLSKGENEAYNLGLTTEAKVPSTLNFNATEAFMEDTSWRTSKMIADCATRSGYQVVNVEKDIDSIAEAIRDYGAVMFLLQGQNNNSWLSPMPIPPSNNQNLWGHYICTDANVPPMLNGKKMIRFYQSWGMGVGDGGFQYLSEDYINSGYIADVFTFIPKYQFTPSIWDKIKEFLLLFSK
jgi:hypothetical protein